MKRLSLLLVVALLAGTASGCRFAIVENAPITVSLNAAQAEGRDLFKVQNPDFSYLMEEEPEDMEPSPSPTPEETPTPTPKPTPAPTAAPAADQQATPIPEVTPAPIGLYSRDENGETKVRGLQERLVTLGYLDDEPDGVFGSLTLKALKRFQSDQGIKATGVLDAATQEALYPRPEVTTAPEDVRYAEGATGLDIRLVHRQLRQYGFSVRPVSNVFGADTAQEVMAFQRYAVEYYGTEFDDPIVPADLPEESGLVESSLDMPGQGEAAVFMTLESAAAEMPAPEVAATLRPHHPTDGVVSENLYQYLVSDRFPVYRLTVQQGDSGVEVERIQRRLVVLDYYYEAVTGEYDAATVQAMKSFQARNDLQQTGIADQETQALLFSQKAAAAEQVDQPFYIKVSLDAQRVYVYRWTNGGYNQLIKTMICSTGFGTTTPKGVFVSPGHRDSRWHYFADFNCWAQYAFVIKGDILFHSVIYSGRSESTLRRSTLANLGHRASHGCVRLRVEDAKWIYDHCGAGQVIEIY